ncbi:MAG: hypothetical protein ACRDL7_00985, partial [Gaiellaceae bacterium]
MNAPSLARGKVNKGSGTGLKDGSTENTAEKFINSIKLDVGQYPRFDGTLDYWLQYKRKIVSIAVTHGLERIFNETEDAPVEGTEDRRLWDAKNAFVYSIFASKASSGQAAVIVRQYETTRDGHAVYIELKKWYEAESNLLVIKQKCESKLDAIKMNYTYAGGSSKFLADFQSLMLDYEYACPNPVDDMTKKQYLSKAIVDRDFMAMRDIIYSNPTITYETALVMLENHTTLLNRHTQSNRQVHNANRGGGNGGGRQGRGRDGQGRGRGRGRDNRVGRNTYINYEVWKTLNKEDKDAIIARRKQNDDSSTIPNQYKNRQAQAASQAPTSDTQTVMSDVTPSIRTIMASQTQTSTTNDNRTSSVLQTCRIMLGKSEVSSKIALIDAGADTCLCGPDFKVTDRTDKKVNVIGFQDEHKSNDLTIGTAITATTLENGETILLRVNQGILVTEGKSLLSPNQIRAFGHTVDDVPRKYRGRQKIFLRDGFEIPLKHRMGLVQMDIRYPTKYEMKNCFVVDLTSSMEWNPGDSDTSGSESDDNATEATIVANTLAVTKTKKKEYNWDKVRQCLGWKPLDVVKATIAATTQLATNVVRYPMRQHFKARFPALNVARLREIFATDTFFASTPALGGV